ncbi:MAG: hypothetical protein BRC40_09965 [Cyanobacteria bacterium QH_8_48_120]|nr:MAG: hypothetical protein BRC34_12740 [Cyanobacteria bacterium QH_1_48_107]PSO55771.1 MAG: hypothetical protein BRC35_10870 [Cyanobacteria bacterium QH_10_48_56]PSO59070.1 MAG: hypothetical protein BRC39_11970 [Cyanobacteria bacterium QH_7_48_89]PSO62358.1 MAG: hypothetical protein BRC36_10215 [Cyanobacteria bacterium QH_2_48_84]PSO65257.1 MAG: hypothetical protein BRC38_09505 [Cyanobacteria bacterium QH_6_48_35]PSO67710.1 MAG: hypothetical protein BRC42_15425 [Cyanobacteria bacterium QS_1_
MNSSEGQQQKAQTVEINWTDRWLVYQRLHELSIPCSCKTSQPLQVEINDPLAAVQLWSVSQQLTAPRGKLLTWLQRCWNKPSG